MGWGLRLGGDECGVVDGAVDDVVGGFDCWVVGENVAELDAVVGVGDEAAYSNVAFVILA